MTPIINPWVIYLIDLADPLKYGSVFVVLILGAWAVTALFEEEKISGKAVTALVLALLLAIFTPDAKTITKMIVAKNVTYERVEVATDTVQRVYEDIMGLFEDGE